MRIVVNGNEVLLEAPCSVQQLLQQRGMPRTPCAVEVNRRLVPKSRHQEHALTDGDQVEIVTLVGGG